LAAGGARAAADHAEAVALVAIAGNVRGVSPGLIAHSTGR